MEYIHNNKSEIKNNRLLQDNIIKEVRNETIFFDFSLLNDLVPNLAEKALHDDYALAYFIANKENGIQTLIIDALKARRSKSSACLYASIISQGYVNELGVSMKPAPETALSLLENIPDKNYNIYYRLGRIYQSVQKLSITPHSWARPWTITKEQLL